MWTPDILGPGFEAQALQLLPDEEGEVVATVVRHLPEEDPNRLQGTPSKPVFRALYIHGWNDYFHQRELARQIALAGGEFYGLDLRKYGRSWRKNQTFGWIRDLSQYDEDIEEAIDLIGDDLPLVLMGHSTGGLTTALWAHRNPGRLAGLWLNSPWLELQIPEPMRTSAKQAVGIIAAREPRIDIPTGGNDFYGRSLRGWNDDDGKMPAEYAEFADDPSLTGWGISPVWKSTGRDNLAGWLAAITDGHRAVANGLDIDCPVLVLASKKAFKGDKWTPEVRFQDAVLDPEIIAERSAHLGDKVCIERIAGVHDLALSIPPVRREVWSATLRWLRHAVIRRSEFTRAESAELYELRVPLPEEVQLAPR